jgi:hypothetical protein
MKETDIYTGKKGFRYSRPQPGCHLLGGNTDGREYRKLFFTVALGKMARIREMAFTLLYQIDIWIWIF